MTRGTSKPCPACGESKWRNTPICSDCIEQLKDGQMLRDEKERAAKNKAVTLVGVPPRNSPHWAPGFYGGPNGYGRSGIRDDIRDTLLKILWAAGTVAKEHKWGSDSPPLFQPKGRYLGDKWEGLHVTLAVPKEVADQVRTLWHQIAEALCETGTLGIAEGADVLRGLASGRVTVEELTRITLDSIKPAKPKR